MSKYKQYDVLLITARKLDEELHFGVFGRFWWQSFKGNLNFIFRPGFVYEANGITSSINDTSSGAINSLYSTLFNSKTRFSGPLICGYNNRKITKEIMNDVPFQLFILTIGKLQVFIGIMRVSDCKVLKYVGLKYMSSFIYQIGKIQTLFVQRIYHHHCSITLYQNEQI
ncbi:11738_t:CDS:2 [Funneliformis mosseae]|uniref:11738_t:CDS:1 n=1 Tax=Funneliformis mosseae TaxID=27381 RepID=A0A9N9A5Q2_FUNMO|nr:11738_t:CDS:2 [Funneliformis mosseae]